MLKSIITSSTTRTSSSSSSALLIRSIRITPRTIGGLNWGTVYDRRIGRRVDYRVGQNRFNSSSSSSSSSTSSSKPTITSTAHLTNPTNPTKPNQTDKEKETLTKLLSNPPPVVKVLRDDLTPDQVKQTGGELARLIRDSIRVSGWSVFFQLFFLLSEGRDGQADVVCETGWMWA